MTSSTRTAECYNVLQNKIRLCETDSRITQTALCKQLIKDQAINWQSIKNEERKLTRNKRFEKGWKDSLIRSLCAPGRFAHGGDRTRARGAKQQAIVEYVEQQAEAAGQELGSDTVADVCIHDVAQRWKCPTAA